MEPKHRDLPVGYRFRPTDLEMATYFLLYKALGRSMKARTVPEEFHDIFSTHPRDLPGKPREREDHWYFYCNKNTNNVTNHNLWKPIGEESDVLNPKKNDEVVGIKRLFGYVENQEYDINCLCNEEEEPPKYNWFIDEISLPSTGVATDWVLCHVFCKKVMPEFVYFSESESEEEEEEEDSVDKPAESLEFLGEQDENILPPPPDSP